MPEQTPIESLLRQLGRDALVEEAKTAGLSPLGKRLKCPWDCVSKGEARERDAVIYAAGHPRIHCYSCGRTGDLVDLVSSTRGLPKELALGYVRGLAVPDARPALSVVRPPAPRVVDDSDRLPTQVVQRVWDSLAARDEAGERYLAGRHLEGAVELGLVRFVAESSAREVAHHAKHGRTVAALLSDVTGQPRGIQLRLAREPRAKEPKVLSLKGSLTSRSFFGRPGDIEWAPVVVVAEGLADSLAARLWSGGRAVVVGAAGQGQLPVLAEELAAAGIELEGKLFALLPQNDRPSNKSRAAFRRLAQLLTTAGARVVWVATPAEHKDVAEWLASAEVEWPPRELAAAMARESDEEDSSEWVLPAECAVQVPRRVRAEVYRQDFTSLCALLDDGAVREAILGQGELEWCEMRGAPLWGGRRLQDEDYSAIRLGLEAQGAATASGKPLKFGEEDIARALALLSRRSTVHPVRQWLTGLSWDGRSRLDGLTESVGHASNSFARVLLRRWLISAVARAMEPGCKVDTVLVLIGKQAALKSTFFSVLGGEWFTDSPVRTDDKDGRLVMREAWIVEWAELESMRRAKDQESIKAFLSSRVDHYRRPYARSLTRSPRHCVIVGTTNQTEFIHDHTGSRRFWPVRVSNEIDVGFVRAAKDQLWAEALALYRSGEQWWLTREEDRVLVEDSGQHEASDGWMDIVSSWLRLNKLRTEVTVGEALAEAIGKEPSSWSRGDEMRVATCLTALGWTQRRRQVDGVRRRYWAKEAAP